MTTLFAIRHAGKLGFIDVRGHIVIPPRFQNAQLSDAYHEGAVDFRQPVPVMLKSQWGYLDARGRFVIEPRFGLAKWFHEGLAAVGEVTRRSYGIPDGRWGYVDLKGTVVIPFQFASAGDFEAGRAVVTVAGENGDLVAHGGDRIIDKRGVIVGKPKKTRWQAPPISEPVADERSGKWGFRDAVKGKAGRVIIAHQFEEAADFSEGLGAVRVGKKWGFVDRAGALVIEPRFEEPGTFSEGRAQAVLKVQEAGRTVKRYGFIDPSGALVIEPRFTRVDEREVLFQHGLAAVVIGKQHAYVDRAGTLVWKERR